MVSRTEEVPVWEHKFVHMNRCLRERGWRLTANTPADSLRKYATWMGWAGTACGGTARAASERVYLDGARGASGQRDSKCEGLQRIPRTEREPRKPGD